jgi:hypothetical protein
MVLIHNLVMLEIKYKIVNLILFNFNNFISIVIKLKIKLKHKKIKKVLAIKKMLLLMYQVEMIKDHNKENLKEIKLVIIIHYSMIKISINNHQHQVKVQNTVKYSYFQQPQ